MLAAPWAAGRVSEYKVVAAAGEMVTELVTLECHAGNACHRTQGTNRYRGILYDLTCSATV